MIESYDRAAQANVTKGIFPSRYVRRLQPALLSYVAASAGFPPPDPKGPFTYLELGCGNGATLNVLAAANPESRFLGIDLNTAHVDYARNDARRGDLANVTYIDGSIDELRLDNIPVCDYIAIRGDYSRLPPSPLNGVHELLSEKLRSGGLCFTDYLCAPGSVPVDPVWVFLREAARKAKGSSEQRVAAGMDILKQLGGADTGYFSNTPMAKAVLARNMRRVDSGRPSALSHLAHHALAEYQKPSYFFEIQEQMARFGLRFAGSTSTIRNDADLCLPLEIQALYSSQEDLNVRELMKDFLLNESQRNDVYIKAESPDEQAAREYLRGNVFIFAMRPATTILKRWNNQFQNWKVRHGADMAVELILDCIDNGKNAFREIERAAEERGEVSHDQLARALNLLLARPEIHLCRKAPGSAPAKHLAMAAPDSRSKDRVAGQSRMVVASPVLGGGLLLGPGLTDALDSSSDSQPDSDSADRQVSPKGDLARSALKRKQDANLMSKLAQLEILA